ncbi:F-box/LRR-repeat/kelch-repeat protein [Carex littledalei]|uniref:F-box/LRR-repeat/kelch-repeat protein n=1 Tax=Carex littledalei TaxID=544730 RepID=A0A833QK69_9POAL|nr:F-box/LRR-repeat/kelch-repeat protein [Carex littledalei]
MANQETPPQIAEQPSEQTEQLNNDATKMILMHAPAISLLRYQLVCKNWAAMIQEPQFKKDHFKRNDATNEPLRLLKEVEEVSSGVFCEKPMVVDVNLQHCKIWMPRDLGSDGQFVGSCNGLLCIEVKGEITVFNPITREVVYLTKATYIKGYVVVHTDFLFHSATGEYKVMLFYWNPTTTSCVVNLYTLCPNSSWRQVGEISCFPYNGGVNVEDTIYWPYMSDYDAIISFDLSKEKIEEQFSDMKDDMLQI